MARRKPRCSLFRMPLTTWLHCCSTPQSNASSQANIVVELQPGLHRVPPGGLLLTAAHSPPASATQQRVIWRAAEAGQRTSIHGGAAITGWQAVKNDPALPAGVMVADVPAALKGKRLRHLYVGGIRAGRTRVSAAAYNLTLAGNPGKHVSETAAVSGCNLTGSWAVGGSGHYAKLVEGAGGSFTATAHGVSKGGWTSAQGTILPNNSLTITFNNGRGSDHATLTPPNCNGVHWADSRRHPAWHRASAPAPPAPAPPAPPVGPPSSLGSYYLSNISEPLSWTNVGDAEFVYSGVASNWAETRYTVAKVSPGSKSSTTEISRASGIC